MMHMYKSTGSSLIKCDTVEESFWLHIEDPEKDELQELVDRYEIPEDFLTDPMDMDENSRIEVEDGITLIIIRLPIYNKTADIPFVTVPMGIIVTQGPVITISPFSNDVMQAYKEGKIRPFAVTPQSFILHIFQRTAVLYLKFLKEINRRTGAIEKELYLSMRNKELLRLLRLEKSLVFFATSLKSNEITLEKMQRSRWLHQDPEADDLLDDVIIENKQAIEMANIYSSILSGMMDAFASIISNNLNVVMKFLTVITIVLMIPNIIFSFYGMNIETPLQHSHLASWFTLLLSVGLSALLVLVFRKRKLF